MEWSKIKNIIIVLLLLVNAFLLLLVGGQMIRDRHVRREAMENAGRILAQNGITVTDEALEEMGERALLPATAARSGETELALARALLGEDAAGEEQSGSLRLYTGQAGTVLFRASGEFSAELSAPLPVEGDPSAQALSLLEKAGLEGEVMEETADGTAAVVTLRQLLDGHPLYTCCIRFFYEDGSLTAVSGTVLPSGQAVFSEQTVLDGPTALIRFLSAIGDSGDICSSVTALRPGYRMTPSFASGLYLQPVWLVSTDASEYYLDGMTGEISRIN